MAAVTSMVVKLAAAAAQVIVAAENHVSVVAAAVTAKVPALACSPRPLHAHSELFRGGRPSSVVVYFNIKRFIFMSRVQTPQDPFMPLRYDLIPIETTFPPPGYLLFKHSGTSHLL